MRRYERRGAYAQCEGEEVLDHEVVRIVSRLVVLIGLQSHAPMKPRPVAPTEGDPPTSKMGL